MALAQLRAAFSPAHPLADILHPPYPPIASQSISRGVPLAQARAFRGRAVREQLRSASLPRLSSALNRSA